MSKIDRAFLKAFSNAGAAATAPISPAPETPKSLAVAREIPQTSCEKTECAKSVCAKITPPVETAAVASPPLAATTTVAPPVQEVAPPAPELSVPAFQVDRFRWPEAVERLTTAAGPELRRAAQEMVTSCGSSGTWLFAGASRGEGCTTLLLTLARTLVAQKVRVAIFDADLTGAALATQLGVRPVEGWEDVLQSGRPIFESLVESIEDSLVIAPLGGRADSCEALSNELRVREALSRLAQSFDIVLIDAGPIAAGPSSAELLAASLPENTAAAVLVRDARRTSASQVEAAGARLLAAGIPQWNVAENFIQLAARRAPSSTRSGDVRSVLATA